MIADPELEAVQNGVLLRPLPELATITITGEDRLTWLGRMITSDVKTLAVGDGAYSLATNKTGRLLAELWLLITEDRVLVGVRRELADALKEHLEAHLVMEDAELSREATYAWWLAYGPDARRVGAEAERLGGASGLGSLAGLPFAALVVPENCSPNVAEALTATTGAVLASPEGWDRIRIERLIPAFGIDFEAGCYPQEARLERLAVSFDKGCYVGQEAVYMLEKRGHAAKRLVRLHVAGAVPLAAGSEVCTVDGTVAGSVTSSAATETDTWALAMLRYKHTSDGSTLCIGERAAVVSEPNVALHETDSRPAT